MTDTQEAVKTPVHLWIIGILTTLWGAAGAMDYIMTKTKNEAYMGQFTPEQLEFFYGFPVWVVVFWALAVWCGLLGSILLLFRRKLAVPTFAVAFVSMTVTSFHNYVLSNGAEVQGGGAAAFSVVIFLVSLGLVIYSRLMAQRGVLR